MGQSISSFYDSIFGNMKASISMIGLDGAGKTTLLYKLRVGEVVTTIPTVGFNVETVEYKSLTFTIWDMGGQDRLRPFWRNFCYNNVDAIIFVVDSADKDRLNIARDEVHKMLAEPTLDHTKLLVFANKQDAPSALSVTEITAGLELHKASRNQEWFVQGCSATRGQGVYEGLDWLAAALKRTNK